MERYKLNRSINGCRMDKDDGGIWARIDDVMVLESKLKEAEAKVEELREAARTIREIDTGAWLKDCGSAVFTCADGRSERQMLMKALDELYKAALIDNKLSQG
jgi:hypothetical protein